MERQDNSLTTITFELFDDGIPTGEISTQTLTSEELKALKDKLADQPAENDFQSTEFSSR